MSAEAASRAIAFDPGSSPLPDELTPPRGEGARVIALLVHDEVRSDGWAERAARALARGWAAADRDVVLVDGDFRTPTLHAVLGVQNGEGLADALVFGASSERVVGEVSGEAFRFVSAGTVMAEPAAGWRSRRWGTFLEGFRAAGTSVFLFLPARGDGVALLAAEADRVLELGRGGADSQLLVPGSRLLFPSRSEAPSGGEPVEGMPNTPEGLTGPEQDTIASKPERLERAESPEAAPGERTAGRRPPLMVSGERPSPRKVKRRAAPWILLAVLVLVVVAIAAWQGLIPGVRIPGLSSGEAPDLFGWFA